MESGKGAIGILERYKIGSKKESKRKVCEFKFSLLLHSLSLSSLGFYFGLLPTNGRVVEDTNVYLSDNSRAAILHFHILI